LVTLKDKKGILGNFFNINRRLHISAPHDPVHLTHVGFDSSTGEFTGLPQVWQQLLQAGGISKTDQERDLLATMEVVKFYQESGGDVRDKMVHAPAPGSSRSAPIPGAAHVAYPGVSKSVDDSFVPVASAFLFGSPQPPTATQQQSVAVTSLAKDASATLPLSGKMEDKSNGADIVKRLQQICTDADPTRLYRNLVKIGQG
jgi:p21-activated kinase 1